MNVFVDTSAVLAMATNQDANYSAAEKVWRRLLAERHALWSTNYVLVETTALLQARKGMPAVQSFQAGIFPLLRIIWIDADMHKTSVQALLLANRRNLSLVDCTSMTVARHFGIQHFFAFDQHFTEQGFVCLEA
jgi:predicted nucleic acid-binding protein